MEGLWSSHPHDAPDTDAAYRGVHVDAMEGCRNTPAWEQDVSGFMSSTLRDFRKCDVRKCELAHFDQCASAPATSRTRTSGTKNLSRACQCSTNNGSDTKVVRTERAMHTRVIARVRYTPSSDAAWVDGRRDAERRSEDRMHYSGAVSDTSPRLCNIEVVSKVPLQSHNNEATTMSKTQVCDGELDARVCKHNARG